MKKDSHVTTDLQSPTDIYRHVARDVEGILTRFDVPSTHPQLEAHTRAAVALLADFRQRIDEQVQALDRNAEWDAFTIAFYGETNAGKSTLIEALRIALGEASKRDAQQAFDQFQREHGLSEADIAALEARIDEARHALAALQAGQETAMIQYDSRQTALLDDIAALQAEAAAAPAPSWWARMLGVFRRTPKDTRLDDAQQRLAEVNGEREAARQAQQARLAEVQQRLSEDEQRQAGLGKALQQLAAYADGGIIGDGRSDFTVATGRFAFEANGQSFVLLDVPGIEGDEAKVHDHIDNAVQTAHAVFYVTGKPTAPQKGEAGRPGTLEKIERHLGPQTEVWTLYNKRVTNPMQLQAARLTSDDEEASLADLDGRVASVLVDQYRGSRTVSAHPAFLANARHLVPGSDNARNQRKFLDRMDADELRQRSGFADFQSFLTTELVDDCKAKIQRSNFNKAREVVDTVAASIATLQQERFQPLSTSLAQDADGAVRQIGLAVKSMRARMRDKGRSCIARYTVRVREHMYAYIEGDHGNDVFAVVLEDCMAREANQLVEDVGVAMAAQRERLEQDIASIIETFQHQAEELLDACRGMSVGGLGSRIDLKFNIDHGIQIGSLIATLIGGAALFWTPVGWLLMIPSALTLAFSAYKAIRGFFSSDFRQTQQRKTVDENIANAADQLKRRLEDGLNEAFAELDTVVASIQASLRAPVEEVDHLNQVLIASTRNLQQLSSRIHAQGTL